MDDRRIVDLYFMRSEKAIEETSAKYGRYIRYIASRILNSDADAEECENDTYLRAWNSMPPKRPSKLSAYLGKITRNLAINTYTKRRAGKRNTELELALDELSEVVADPSTGEDAIINEIELTNAINAFLGGLKAEYRIVFVRRYWYMSSVREIADDYGLSISGVKITLHRLRKSLHNYLKEKGIEI